jgi:hypothetical protein
MITKIEISEEAMQNAIANSSNREAFEAAVRSIDAEVHITLPTTAEELKKLRDNRRLTFSENYERFRNILTNIDVLSQTHLPDAEKEKWHSGLEADKERYLARCVEYLRVYDLANEGLAGLQQPSRTNRRQFFDTLQQRVAQEQASVTVNVPVQPQPQQQIQQTPPITQKPQTQQGYFYQRRSS